MWNYFNARKVIVLILFIGKLSKIFAADEIIDCSGEELVTSVFNEPIDLTLNGTIKIYENILIDNILSTSNNEFDLKYIDARLENVQGAEAAGNTSKNLIIFATENFTNYAREQTATRISLKINLGCGSGRERIIVFFQPLKEANYYGPVFSQPMYELLMPTPIFAGFDLTAFLEITARDDDLTNNQINFTSITSSQHHISVGNKNLTSSDKKTYFANMTLDRIYLELPQQIEFVIIATDNGTPPRSSNASVIIRSDTTKRLPLLPRFSRNLYKGTINVDFSMDPIRVNLSNGSYVPEVRFTLNGTQTEGFEMIDNKNGNIEIRWDARKVNQSVIMQHKSWELTLKAEHPMLVEFSTATIMIELADFQSFFHFMSAYHDGIIDANNNVQVSPIIFYPYMYKPNMKFILMENPHNMFSVSNQGFQVYLQLLPQFNLDAFANDAFIKLAIQASWEELSAVTLIIITLPPRPANGSQQQQQHMFRFEQPLYVGNITEMHELEMDTIVLQTDVNTTQPREFQLTGQWSDWFRLVMLNDDRVRLEMNNTTNFESLKLDSAIFLVLEAKQQQNQAFTNIVIQGPPKQIVATSSDVFLSHSLIAKLTINGTMQEFSMDPIELRSVNNIQDYVFNIDGEVSQNFELITDIMSLQMQLILKEQLANSVLEANKMLMLSIHAKLNRSANILDTLMVFIEIPMKDCAVPAASLPNPPIFSHSNYVFTTFTNTTGSLGAVKAYSAGFVATLHYNLEVESDFLAQRLSVEPFGGELMLYGSLDEGSYNFNITAENVETQEIAHVQAVLNVRIKEECRLFEGPAVEKTLVIKHIDEEMPHHGLWNMKFNVNCTFEIVEMWPKQKEYVYINESSQMLDILAVDREDPIFEHMLAAQILVKLKLNCGTQQESLEANVTMNTRSFGLPDMIYTEDIVYAPDVMWLHIHIDDINDNAPVFNLTEKPLYLGYPSGKAALDIYPEYLTQIEANDRDLDFNAQIRYSMRDNEYFAIEPETGIIYPKGQVLQPQQQTELIVLATDQDGTGLLSGVVLIVQGLSPEYYSLATIRENSGKSLDEVMQQLREETGYEVKIIKMSFVPQTEARLTGSQGLVCKAWIYAYRDQQLVQCKELQDKFLEKSPDANIINLESYEEAAQQSVVNQNSTSTVGYLVAVVLLSLISATAIVFIIWRYYYFGESPFVCNTKGNLSTHHNQQQQHQHSEQPHGNGQQMTTACSHGIVNKRECSACGDYSTNHVKFSALVGNQNVD